MKIRILSLLLLLAVIAAGLLSCGKKDPPPEPDSNSSQTQDPEQPTSGEDPEYTPNTQLTDLDFDLAVVRILTCKSYNEYEFIAEKGAQERVEKAVFARNQQVEQDLNISFDYKTCNANDRDITPLKTVVTQSINDGSEENTFHIVANPAYYATSMIQTGLYKDLSSIEENYVSIGKKYWLENYVSESVINGKYYFLVGEPCISVLDRMEIAFVNNSIYNSYFAENGSAPDIYQMVYDRKWTYEKMLEMLREVGAGESTGTWGIVMPCNSLSIDGFLMSFELDMLKRNSDGSFSGNINTAHNQDLIEDLRTLYYDNPAVRQTTSELPEFKANSALFGVTLMKYVGEFYKSEVPYSIIPLPLWDEAQSDYHVISHDGHSALSIASNVRNFALVTAVLEDLAYRSHSTVYPAVYEETYQLGYNEVPENVEMFDFIYEHLTFPMGSIYSYVLGELKNTPRYLLYPSSNTFVANRDSSIVGKLQPLQENLKTYINIFMENFE